MSDFKHELVLIEGLKEGNEKIFDFLFHLYYSGLVVFSEKYTANREVAEDIVQDFFVKLWVNRRELQINQSIKSYFFTSVKNRSFDYLRHQQVKSKLEGKIIAQAERFTHDHHYFIESELRSYIDQALEKLPPVCREVFVLNRFDGLKPIEIAEKKGISVRTVEGHIGKALKIMKTELEQHLPLSIATAIVSYLI